MYCNKKVKSSETKKKIRNEIQHSTAQHITLSPLPPSFPLSFNARHAREIKPVDENEENDENMI